MASALEALASGASILGYIDTAINVANFLISERLPVTVENIRAYFRGKSRPENFDPQEAASFVQLLVIDEDLLNDLTDKVKNGVNEYRDCLKKAVRPQESAACDRKAEITVCDTLNRVMDRNKDELPSDYLDNQWQSFSCVRVKL
jgi:hypothetical protein